MESKFSVSSILFIVWIFTVSLGSIVSGWLLFPLLSMKNGSSFFETIEWEIPFYLIGYSLVLSTPAVFISMIVFHGKKQKTDEFYNSLFKFVLISIFSTFYIIWMIAIYISDLYVGSYLLMPLAVAYGCSAIASLILSKKFLFKKN